MQDTFQGLVFSAVWLLALFTQAAFAAEGGWGKWEDDSGATYEFLPNNEFRFSGVNRVLVPLTGTARLTGRVFGSTGRRVAERHNLSGAWEASPNVCPSGNLRLYVDSAECCIDAKHLGRVLVLSVVSSKGESPACVSRTLQEVKPGQ